MEPSQHPSTPAAEGAVPYREFGDPQVLRVFAHPVRLRMLDALAVYGKATATELAERLDESPSNCSWHLRQLAKHGFVEAAEGGTGRQRPWRLVPWRTRIGESEQDADLARAEDSAMELLLGRQVAALNEWHARRRHDAAEWRTAGLDSQAMLWLTAEEAAGFKREFDALLERHLSYAFDRLEPAARPPGSRPVRIVAWSAPGPADAQTPADDAPSPADPPAPGSGQAQEDGPSQGGAGRPAPEEEAL